MHREFYALNDLPIEVEIVDIDPATGLEVPVPSVSAFLAAAPDATAPADPTLTATGVNTSGNTWLVTFDQSVMLPAVLDPLFGAAPAYAIIEGGDVRVVLELDYSPTRPAISALQLLKSALRIRNDAEDDYIQMLYHAAIATIERDTGHWYGPPKTVTEVVSGYGDVIWLLSTPNSVTSVESYEGGQWNAITAYEVTGRRITLTEDVVVWPEQRRVVYETGYALEDIPADVWLRIVQLVTLWFEQRLPTVALAETQWAVLGGVGGI